jgi:hypothetical protein
MAGPLVFLEFVKLIPTPRNIMLKCILLVLLVLTIVATRFFFTSRNKQAGKKAEEP